MAFIARNQAPAPPAVTGRRIAARARVALPATLETVRGTERAVLRNISETGLMLEVAHLPALGADAVVLSGGLDCFGTVVWTRFRWCGVAFEEPISHSEVLRIRQLSEQSTGAAQKELQEAASRWAQGGNLR
jgi:hypothetical protein